MQRAVDRLRRSISFTHFRGCRRPRIFALEENKMKKQRYYMTFRRPRTRTIKALNNLSVINTIARNSLREVKTNLQCQRSVKLRYKVPVVSGETITVARRKSKIISLLDKAINRDLYSQSLITAVAITEDYLSKSLATILEWYPQKLSVYGDKKVDLTLILDSENKEELLQRIIFKVVYSIFYPSPAKYFETIEEILAITYQDPIKKQFSEIKATRDLLVHNSGIVNSIYLAKSKDLARGSEGEVIPLDNNYFDNSLRCMKRIISKTYSQLLQKYGNKPPKNSIERTQFRA